MPTRGKHPRVLWFCELFANVGLQGCIENHSAPELPMLETLFGVVSAREPPPWTFTRLQEMCDAMATPGGCADRHRRRRRTRPQLEPVIECDKQCAHLHAPAVVE